MDWISYSGDLNNRHVQYWNGMLFSDSQFGGASLRQSNPSFSRKGYTTKEVCLIVEWSTFQIMI